MLTAYFYHKTTGLPLTDWLVTVSVTLANMNNDTKVLDNATMSPSASFSGAFRHSYPLDKEVDYMAYYSSSDSNYVASVDKLFIPATSSWGGGWFSINYGVINWHVTKKVNELDEKVMKELELLKWNDKEIYNKINETDSHIELAKVAVIDTINSQETDDTEIIKSLGIIKSNLTKLSQFVRNEAQKEKEMEKEWMKTEYEYKISELVDKMEDMEDAYEELDWSIITKEKLIEDMEKTAQEIIDELEKQKELAKSEWEKGIKEKLISSLSE